MMQRRLPRLTPAMTVLAAIIVLLVLVDVVVATRLVATRSTSPAAGSSQQAASGHPCNHGYYVSQAAHSKKGGHKVSGIANSNAGKDGKCTAPLPANAQVGSDGSDEGSDG
ncbi:MAG: hypothetical protein E6J08_12710 [Chloroflexi bacterium]|nr:MAG: hypothetical protein E6J08_12710 [Chloroflexota bacterium]